MLILFDKSTKKIFIVIFVSSCNNMHIGAITFKKISVLMCMNSGQYVYFDINFLKKSVLANMNS